MKLKNVLVSAFLVLTLIPIVIVTLLLYQSGLNLSKESYTRNLIESMNVQVDYISQTIENNMITDYRFVNKNFSLYSGLDNSSEAHKSKLLTAFQSYLEASEDKIAVCILLDKNNAPIYTIGEKAVLDTVSVQLPELSGLTDQIIWEFNLGQGTYSLGIITPILDNNHVYLGSLVSIYDKSYIFKIISSYYKITDTSIYVCRENRDIIDFIGFSDKNHNSSIEQALDKLTFTSESIIDMNVGKDKISGYYKNIHNSPWYLVGFINNDLIYTFTNQFIWVYIFIIIGVLIADIMLSFYFSQKVVEPINGLIKVMDGYQNSLNSNDLKYNEKNGYFETQYLRTKFLSLMKTILLVQHNFEGVYQLYQSSAMDDTNIDIDVKNQTVNSNKEAFENLMNSLKVPKENCVVEKFIKCFCDKDQIFLMDMFESMRDEHLSVTREAEVYTPHLNEKWFHILVVPMYDGDRLSRLFVQLRDISSFKKQEFVSFEQARRDPLTQLYNRSGFVECVNKVLQRGNATDMHGLLFIDMNYFKMVNDNLGHRVGDDLLCSISKVLLNTISANDIASRIGGDEFVVFLTHTSTELIVTMKEMLNQRLIYPFHTEKISFVVSASIGISTWDCQYLNTLETLLQQADEDMYKAKREFKQKST